MAGILADAKKSADRKADYQARAKKAWDTRGRNPKLYAAYKARKAGGAAPAATTAAAEPSPTKAEPKPMSKPDPKPGETGYDPWAITPQKALQAYVTQGYAKINAILRGKATSTDADQKVVMALDSLFDDAKPLDRDIEVYRGMTGNTAGKLRDLEVGATFSDAAYVSTSTDKTAADFFATGGHGDKGGARVSFVIKVPKGTKAIDGEKQEAELILKRGVRFKVVGKAGSVLTLEVLP